MKVEWDFNELYNFAEHIGNTSKFEREMKYAVKEISAVLLKNIKNLTPIDKTWQLINGWNGNSFLVRQVDGGFEVELVNTTEYATWVNDGHRVRNQADGEYLQVHNRVKVPTAHKWQKPKNNYYVFGHFFVERGILQVSNTTQVEEIIAKKLQKWWDSV